MASWASLVLMKSRNTSVVVAHSSDASKDQEVAKCALFHRPVAFNCGSQ